MSLSKECDQVSSTSGDPTDASDLVRFRWMYFQLATDRVQSLFAKQAALERKQALTMIELQKALAVQTEAECNWRSSCLSDFPVLSEADITSVLGLDLSALGDLVLGPQPPVTTQSAAATAVRSTSTNPALPCTAATTVRRPRLPKLTILSPWLATATIKNTPTKPGKRSSVWPVCRKPSKWAAPPTTSEDDLPASTPT